MCDFNLSQYSASARSGESLETRVVCRLAVASWNTAKVSAFTVLVPHEDSAMDNVAETTNLIAGSKVTGTDVYNKDAENIGKIHDVMVDKRSGQVAYAVMSFGGFLGLGENYHPIPWSLLTYSPALDGYVVNLTRRQLEGSPSYPQGADPDWNNESYGSDLGGYWGVAT
jgi:sporulation protein YlmC with PRC-barrel domain